MAPRPRQLLALLGLIVGVAALPPASLGADIAVVVSRDAPKLQLARVALRNIYLKKIFVDRDGDAIIAVNLPAGHPLRKAFSLALFGETSDQLQGYWNERYFHGVRPPYVLESQDAVLRFVARTPGAIGYVARCKVNDKVRQVMTLALTGTAGRAVDELCKGQAGSHKR